MESGYAQLIKELATWHFLAPPSRRNTFVIQGETATGKTAIRDLWESIFPCHQYIQMVGTNFTADQRKRIGRLRHYKATSITVNEGCYDGIFQNMSEAKEFLEGLGKVP